MKFGLVVAALLSISMPAAATTLKLSPDIDLLVVVDTAVIKVARIAGHPQRLGLPLSGIAKPHPLHHAIHIRSNANLCHNRPLN